jgi:ATP-dependent Zn protease
MTDSSVSRNKINKIKEDEATNPQLSWSSRFRERVRRFLDTLDATTRKRALVAMALMTIGWMASLKGYKTLLQARQRRHGNRSAEINDSYHSAKNAPASFLYKAIKDGAIQQALIGSSGVFYKLINEKDWKQSKLPAQISHKEILETLLSNCHDVSALPEPLRKQFAAAILAALPFLYLGIVYRMLQNSSGGVNGTTPHDTSSNTTTFKDVAGLDSVIENVREIVTYLNEPSKYLAIGARPPRGVLLYGPSGTGKTLLAQAVAGEARVDCFLACSASDFVEVYVGRGAARVRSLFARARNDARRKRWWERLFSGRQTRASAIIFIDEIDALAKTRGGFGSNDEREQALNQLLVELDGFANESDVTLVVMAASNRADVLDPAVMRRFDRQIHVGFPDEKGRKEILEIHGRRIACNEAVNWELLATDENSAGFSGADLRNIVNDAGLLAVRDRSAMVEQKHFEHAVRRAKQMKWQVSVDPGILHELPDIG